MGGGCDPKVGNFVACEMFGSDVDGDLVGLSPVKSHAG